MDQVRVVTDSGADLPAEAAQELEVTVVPLSVCFGREMYLESQLSSDEFWQKTAASAQPPSTSQPSWGAFEEVFDRLTAQGHPVLCVTLTSKHSGTYSTAWAAAQRFGDKIKVLDSLSISLGQGFQVLAAAQAAIRGLSLERITEIASSVRERVRLFILLDTIENLKQGGRASLLIPALSRVVRFLDIKPILTMVEGQLSLHSLARSYERGLDKIREEIAQLPSIERLAVLHVRCKKAAHHMAQALAEKLNWPYHEIIVRETGAALSTHGGPGVIGVIALRRQE